MKKRALSLLLALVMVFGLLPVTARAGELDDVLVYEVYEDHVEITGYNGNLTELVIPAEIEGLPVTAIGDYIFDWSNSLISISIPASITYIGECAFYRCYDLTRFQVHEDNPNYSSDNRGVLYNKRKTLLIKAPSAIADPYTIPDSVTSIGDSAFHNCESLTSIDLPDSLTSIGEYAFTGCDALSSINIPDSVTYIGTGAFSYCKSLNSIDIPDSLTSIADRSFEGCNALTSIVIPNGVTYIGEWAFYACGSLTSIDLPDSLTSIGEHAFAGCDALPGIDIPDSVTIIDIYAFSGCDSLTRIDIPDSVTYIGFSAFASCNNLTGIHVDKNNPNYSSDNRGVLFNKKKTLLIQPPGAIADSYAIPDSVTQIEDGAFYSCNNLTNIDIPDSVTQIGGGTFQDCLGLTSIVIPDSITSIGGYAFYRCYNLSSFYFEGDAPKFGATSFSEVTATAYYPGNNSTWTKNVKQDYEGKITWIGYNPEGSFYDVAMDSFYEAPVEWAVKKGITNGTTATTFNPNGDCLRAHVVTFLHRAAKNPNPTTTHNPFSDVKTSDFFHKPVLWAVENGITNGTSATTFGSYDVCNRAAVVTFLWRAAGSPEPESTDNPFVDVKDTDFFYKPVLWAIENGITNGVDATHFGPTSPCNRAQVVTFLYRTYN